MNQDVFNCKFGNGTCNENGTIPIKTNGNGMRGKYLNRNECYFSAMRFPFETIYMLFGRGRKIVGTELRNLSRS